MRRSWVRVPPPACERRRPPGERGPSGGGGSGGDLKLRPLPQRMNEEEFVHGGSAASEASVQRVDVHGCSFARKAPTHQTARRCLEVRLALRFTSRRDTSARRARGGGPRLSPGDGAC